MVAALQRIWSETTGFLPLGWGRSRPACRTEPTPKEYHMIGEFQADYDELPAEDWRAETPEIDDLLRRSKVVSVTQGL